MEMQNEEDDAVSSSDEEECEKVDNARIQRLTLEAEANPYQYDKHIELIAALRDSGDLDQLRSARENMSSIYPLSEELWLQWFQDELPLVVIPEQREYIVSKFEAAIKDYASTKIWHEYCQYMMNNIESPADIERARNVFERAITAVGLHVTEGASIWDGYREFEIAILDSYQQLQVSGDTVGMDAKVQVQIERIASIFRRQLSIPLLGMSDILQIYEDWSSKALSGETQRSFEKANQKLLLVTEYEEKLHTATGNKLAEYLEYINYEIKDGDPARIQCIFERAIKDNCLQYDLWEKYTNYLDYNLKIPTIAISAHARAVQNCPWVSKLWQNYLKALERSNTEYSRVKEIFNQSLKGGFAGAEAYLQIWVANCDYHRRRIGDWTFEEKVEELHKTFEGAVTYMNHYFGLEGDKNNVLLREWAHIEAKYLQNVKRGQELWDTVMKKHSRDSNMWMEYVHYLMLFSDVVTVRRVFQRAVQISLEQPERICEEFIKFERQYGTLETVDDAQQKVDVQVQRVKERRAKEALKDASIQQASGSKRKQKGKPTVTEDGQSSKKKKKKNKLGKEKNLLKRSADTDNVIEPRAKKQKDNSESGQIYVTTSDTMSVLPGDTGSQIECITAKGEEVVFPELTVENITSNIQTSGEVTINELTSSDRDLSEAPVNADDNSIQKKRIGMADYDEVSKVDNDLSVFLSNLLFTVDEMHIREMFQKCGDIETVRIIVNGIGKSKGYAYMQFKHKESVEKALKLDREGLLGRPVFVSSCVDKKQHPTQFKFPTSLDQHTLYVSNLPFELSSDELTEYFSQVGKLKQFRLVTNRSGKSKGYAYVEYETEADAKSAIVKFDQQLLKERPINVALSNPPARKQNKQNESNSQKQQTKTRTQEIPGSRGRAKTQLSLLPRSIQTSHKPKTDVKVQPTTDTVSSTTGPISTDPSTTSTAAMSNSDFRKFLLK